MQFLADEVQRYMLSNNMESLYKDIENNKLGKHKELTAVQRYLLKPRSALISQADTLIFAFIYDPNSPGTLARERYSKIEKSWAIVDNIEIPVEGSPYAMIQSRNSWYLFDQSGRILCIDMLSLAVTFITTVSRRNYAVAIHNDNIYVVAGYEHNPVTDNFDLPLKSIVR